MDAFGRPDWDTFFMSLAFLTSQRSIDKHTKHGTVVTSYDNTILSVGYNGPPRGCIDENIPLERPDKYNFMAHSEENAIANAARQGICLRGSTFYVTGMPCAACFRKIINVGAEGVMYGPVTSSCVDEESENAINIMKIGTPIILVKFNKKIEDIKSLLNQTVNYVNERSG